MPVAFISMENLPQEESKTEDEFVNIDVVTERITQKNIVPPSEKPKRQRKNTNSERKSVKNGL